MFLFFPLKVAYYNKKHGSGLKKLQLHAVHMFALIRTMFCRPQQSILKIISCSPSITFFLPPIKMTFSQEFSFPSETDQVFINTKLLMLLRLLGGEEDGQISLFQGGRRKREPACLMAIRVCYFFFRLGSHEHNFEMEMERSEVTLLC